MRCSVFCLYSKPLLHLLLYFKVNISKIIKMRFIRISISINVAMAYQTRVRRLTQRLYCVAAADTDSCRHHRGVVRLVIPL